MTMRVLTVHNPFAWFLSLPASHPMAKRCENRSWPTNYRGPVAIHAGLSTDSMQRPEWNGMELPEMVYGAIVAVGTLVACVHVSELPTSPWGGGWMERQRQVGHVIGPWCHIFDDKVVALETPIPIRGGQGYFTLSERSLKP